MIHRTLPDVSNGPAAEEGEVVTIHVPTATDSQKAKAKINLLMENALTPPLRGAA
ncbi:MAG TPA: hypothetical protein VKG91_07175 [Roseiarcus sp.]|nr:hypothetical protein [Roseiarcus sp.]